MLPVVRCREEVYRAYWHLACERQRIFHRRARGEPGPWTADAILREYKFTNAYRASDRVSQFLIGDVIYGSHELPAQDVLCRIVLFRLFSRVETWQALEAQLGPITAATLDDPRLDAALEALRREGPIYTSAFILCAHDAFGLGRKHRNHVALVRSMLHDRPGWAGGAGAWPGRRLCGAGRVPADRAVHGLPAGDRHQLLRADRLQRGRLHRRRARRRARHPQGLPRRDAPADDDHHHADGRRAAQRPRAVGAVPRRSLRPAAACDRLPEPVLRARQVQPRGVPAPQEQPPADQDPVCRVAGPRWRCVTRPSGRCEACPPARAPRRWRWRPQGAGAAARRPAECRSRSAA